MPKLFRRGKTFYAWVPDPRGGYRKVTTGCTDRKAAEAVQARLEREAVDPKLAAQSQALTRTILSDLLLSLKRKNRAVATYRFNEQKAANLVDMLPERAAEITHRVLEGYVDRRLSEGAARMTVAKELGVLREALNLARRNGLFAEDPRTILPDLDVEYVPRTRVLTQAELVAICGALDPMKAARVAWMVATAARWSESVRAQADDVRDGGGRWFLRGTKTKESRAEVEVPAPFRPILRWALARANQAGKLFDAWPSPGNDLRRVCERLKIPHASFNDLRRTHATWLSDLGVEPHLIASQLRHTTSTLAEKVYGKLRRESAGRLIEERVGGGLLMGGEGREGTVTDVTDGTQNPQFAGENLYFAVGQDRLELSANGLRDRLESRKKSQKSAKGAHGWAPNGQHPTSIDVRSGEQTDSGERLPSLHGAELDAYAYAERLEAALESGADPEAARMAAMGVER